MWNKRSGVTWTRRNLTLLTIGNKNYASGIFRIFIFLHTWHAAYLSHRSRWKSLSLRSHAIYPASFQGATVTVDKSGVLRFRAASFGFWHRFSRRLRVMRRGRSGDCPSTMIRPGGLSLSCPTPFRATFWLLARWNGRRMRRWFYVENGGELSFHDNERGFDVPASFSPSASCWRSRSAVPISGKRMFAHRTMIRKYARKSRGSSGKSEIKLLKPSSELY